MLLVCLLLTGCFSTRNVDASLQRAVDQQDALALADALETLIERGEDTRSDREYAHFKVQAWSDGTAAYNYARAMLAARLAEQRGIAGLEQVKDAEKYALRSISISPTFQDGAARRLLGSLYVMAGQYTRHGDSEAGLAMLQDLAAQFPDDSRNQLRLAEAFIVLGDVEMAVEPLCEARAREDGALRVSEEALLVRLIAEAGGEEMLECEG